MLLGVPEYAGHAGGELGPPLCFGVELFPAGAGDLVYPGAALVFGHEPLGGDPACLLHAMKSRVKRTLFHSQSFLREFLNGRRDSVAVLRAAPPEDGEHKEIERGLGGVRWRRHTTITRVAD